MNYSTNIQQKFQFTGKLCIHFLQLILKLCDSIPTKFDLASLLDHAMEHPTADSPVSTMDAKGAAEAKPAAEATRASEVLHANETNPCVKPTTSAEPTAGESLATEAKMSAIEVKPVTEPLPNAQANTAPSTAKTSVVPFNHISPTSTISSTPPQKRNDPRIIEGEGNAQYKASCMRRRRVYFYFANFSVDRRNRLRSAVNWKHCIFIENLNEYVTTEILELILRLRIKTVFASRISPVRGIQPRFAKVAYSSKEENPVGTLQGSTVAGCSIIVTEDPGAKLYEKALRQLLEGTYVDPVKREAERKAAAAKALAEKAAAEKAATEKAAAEKAAVEKAAAEKAMEEKAAAEKVMEEKAAAEKAEAEKAKAMTEKAKAVAENAKTNAEGMNFENANARFKLSSTDSLRGHSFSSPSHRSKDMMRDSQETEATMPSLATRDFAGRPEYDYRSQDKRDVRYRREQSDKDYRTRQHSDYDRRKHVRRVDDYSRRERRDDRHQSRDFRDRGRHERDRYDDRRRSRYRDDDYYDRGRGHRGPQGRRDRWSEERRSGYRYDDDQYNKNHRDKREEYVNRQSDRDQRNERRIDYDYQYKNKSDDAQANRLDIHRNKSRGVDCDQIKRDGKHLPLTLSVDQDNSAHTLAIRPRSSIEVEDYRSKQACKDLRLNLNETKSIQADDQQIPGHLSEAKTPPKTVAGIRFAMLPAHIEERDVSAYVSRFGQSVDTFRHDPFWIVTFSSFPSRDRVLLQLANDYGGIGSGRRVKPCGLREDEVQRMKKESRSRSRQLSAHATPRQENRASPINMEPETDCANIYLDKYLNHDADDIYRGMQRNDPSSQKQKDRPSRDHQAAHSGSKPACKDIHIAKEESECKARPRRKRSRFSDSSATANGKRVKVEAQSALLDVALGQLACDTRLDTGSLNTKKEKGQYADAAGHARDSDGLEGDSMKVPDSTCSRGIESMDISKPEIIENTVQLEQSDIVMQDKTKLNSLLDVNGKLKQTGDMSEKDRVQAMIDRDAALALALARADIDMYAPATTRSKSRRGKPSLEPEKKEESTTLVPKTKLSKTRKKPVKKGKSSTGSSTAKKSLSESNGRVSSKRDGSSISKKKVKRSRSTKKKEVDVVKVTALEANMAQATVHAKDLVQKIEVNIDDGLCARSRPYIPKNKQAASVVRLPDEQMQLQQESNSARTRRQQMRRLRKGLSSFPAGDGAMIMNTLETRKKQTFVMNSKIHGFGLFAGERIEQDQFIIEYVGEAIRNAMADLREKKYIAQGIGSSYLFKLDEDWILDSTMKGSKARYVNHSCDPNTYAKVISVAGERRMCFYSVRPIQRGEELTFNYKFQEDDEDEKKINCLCRSSNCRKFMN